MKWEFERDGDYFSLDVEPPTKRHRRLFIEGSPPEVNYELGGVWTEGLDPQPDVLRHLLAECDAVREGRVREVRDLDTGVLWHVYRLKTRGLDYFVRDTQYSIWHYFRRRVRRVKIQRLPPLHLA